MTPEPNPRPAGHLLGGPLHRTWKDITMLGIVFGVVVGLVLATAILLHVLQD